MARKWLGISVGFLVIFVACCLLCREELKNRKFDKKTCLNFHSEQQATFEKIGLREDEKFEENPIQPKTDSLIPSNLTPKQGNSYPKESTEFKSSPFFVTVPIIKYSSIQAPCIEVNIDGKVFSMELDLGFRGDLSLKDEFVDQIGEKIFIRIKSMYGIQGKEYATDYYQLPKIKIGAMTFVHPLLQKEDDAFTKDSVFVQEGSTPSPGESGRIGWELLYNTNLLIDIPNSKIAFCDSLDTLEKQGYLTQKFVKVPLLLEQGLIELEGNTPQGALRCMLDTGAT